MGFAASAHGQLPNMALRVAIGVFAALRAVLVYGEAGELASRPLVVPARTPSLWDLGADEGSALGLGVR